MREALRLGSRLLVIALIAGLALGAAYVLTKEPIARQSQLAAQQARSRVFPGDFAQDTQTKLTGNIQAMYLSAEQKGYILEVKTSGYGGPFLVTVGVAADGEIRGVVVGDNKETPGLGKNAQNESFTAQFVAKNGQLAVKKGGAAGEAEVDALTGATITTQAVTDAVNEARDFVRGLGGMAS